MMAEKGQRWLMGTDFLSDLVLRIQGCGGEFGDSGETCSSFEHFRKVRACRCVSPSNAGF